MLPHQLKEKKNKTNIGDNFHAEFEPAMVATFPITLARRSQFSACCFNERTNERTNERRSRNFNTKSKINDSSRESNIRSPDDDDDVLCGVPALLTRNHQMITLLAMASAVAQQFFRWLMYKYKDIL
jgi:hypothetical protein